MATTKVQRAKPEIAPAPDDAAVSDRASLPPPTNPLPVETVETFCANHISELRKQQVHEVRFVKNGEQMVAFVGDREVARVNLVGGREAKMYGGDFEYAKHRLGIVLAQFSNVGADDILKCGVVGGDSYAVLLTDGTKYYVTQDGAKQL